MKICLQQYIFCSLSINNGMVLIFKFLRLWQLGREHARDLTYAMLDLLDPKQNANFVDNYFFFPIDLSKVSHCGDVETLEVVFLQDLSSN